jgi:phosphoribosylformimino-5-aminoimidazole carboxamide ribotide isomerase
MRLIPVLDVQQGRVVHGVGGRRSEYRPVVSRLTPSCRPADVARAFREHFGVGELYLADLDAIGGAGPAIGTYAELAALGFRLHVEAGVRELKGGHALARAGAWAIVAGLETIAGPAVLAGLCEEIGAGRVLFSLDLKNGQPLGNVAAWDAPEAWPIARQAARTGVRAMIVLDLARVGTGAGIGTEDLCKRLAETFPEVEVIAGGGVRGPEDLARLRRCGARAVLVSSALHDGRLRREDFAPDEPGA